MKKYFCGKFVSLWKVLLVFVLLNVFVVLGSGLSFYLVGLNHGFEFGQKITNQWWIDQRSNYFSPEEIGKKRIQEKLDFI